MTDAARVPGFLGRVMAADGRPRGTCFQVADGVLVTAWHVLEQVDADQEGSTVHVEPLGLAVGQGRFAATTKRTDHAHDLAVLTYTGAGLFESVAGLLPTDSVDFNTAMVVSGFPDMGEADAEYQYRDAPGFWAGGTVRNELPLGQLTCNGVVPGMSGAPVRRVTDGMVAGVVCGRFNSFDGWVRDQVWIARTEDLRPLLFGVADPLLAAAEHRPGPIEATLTVDDATVSLSCKGTTTSFAIGEVPYALVDALERLGRDRAQRTGVRHAGVATESPAAPSGAVNAVGRLLASTFLSGPVADRVGEVLASARSSNHLLRLAIRTSGRWARLPWEAMHLPHGTAASIDPNVQIFRLAETATPLAASAGPLRILVAISSPLSGGGGVLDYERELRNVIAAVRGARSSTQAHVDIVQFATTAEIRAAIEARHRAGSPVHVLHLSGHGGPGVFELEDDSGDARPMTVETFMAEAIPVGMTPPVFALSACHTDAATATGDPSFATGLLARGVCAVIATETAITDIYATRVFARLYQELASGESDIVSAVTAARQAVQRELAASKDDRDKRLAALDEWTVLRVHAAPGTSRLVDTRLPAVEIPLTTPVGGVLRRGIGEVVGRRLEQRRWPQTLLGPTVSGMVIHGLGGIGKTTLADELLRRIQEREPSALIATLVGAINGPQLIHQLAEKALGHFHSGQTARTAQVVAALERALEQSHPERQRLEGLRDFLEAINSRLVVVLDNFEDNLAGTAAASRDLTSIELGQTLAALTTLGDRIKLLITCRYTFALPGNAQNTLSS